jgi:acyl carrier protein
VSSTHHYLQNVVLTVHRRNGGQLSDLDFSLPLLDQSLVLDSLDLAEIMAAIEHKFGKSPFDAPTPPRTWCDIAVFLDTSG